MAGRSVDLRRTGSAPDGDAFLEAALFSQCAHEFRNARLGDFHEGLGLLDADCADRILVEPSGATQQRQQPARLGTVIASDRQGEPDARAEACMRLRSWSRIDRDEFLGRRVPGAILAQIGCCNRLR